METVDALKKELERLNLELDQTSSEKKQAAQYGLVLLEEKESLQSRCDDLEALYENTKVELESTREVREMCQWRACGGVEVVVAVVDVSCFVWGRYKPFSVSIIPSLLFFPVFRSFNVIFLSFSYIIEAVFHVCSFVSVFFPVIHLVCAL